MNILTRRIGPLPAWVWGAAAAGAIWFLFLRGKATTASRASSTGATSGDYSLGFAQGLQAANPPPAAAAASAPARQTITIRDRTGTGPYAQYDASAAGVPVYLRPGQNQIGVVPFGSSQQLAPAAEVGPSPGSGQQFLSRGNPAQGPSNGFTTQYWGIQYGPVTGWVGANDVAGTGTGGAVGGPVRKHAIGSRSSAPVWHEAHPLVGAPVRYPHFVRAVGGAANHRREVHRVASQAGVHPARVAMLNPVPSGMIRVA